MDNGIETEKAYVKVINHYLEKCNIGDVLLFEKDGFKFEINIKILKVPQLELIKNNGQ